MSVILDNLSLSEEEIEKWAKHEEEERQESNDYVQSWTLGVERAKKENNVGIEGLKDFREKLAPENRILVDYFVNYLNSKFIDKVHKLDLYNGRRDISVFVIPGAKIVLDYFNESKSDLYDRAPTCKTADYYYDEVMGYLVKEDPYKFYTLGLMRQEYEQLLYSLGWSKESNMIHLERGGVIPICESELKVAKTDFLLNTIFKNDSNWKIIKSFIGIKTTESMLPYNVVCYEKPSYIEEREWLLIETTFPCDKVCINDYSTDKDVLVFVLSDSNEENGKELVFKGVYSLDIDMTKKENHFVFRQERTSFDVDMSVDN